MPARSKDLIREADAAAIAASRHFTLIRWIGRTGRETGPLSYAALRERSDFTAEEHGSGPAALAAARRAKVETGADEHGRRPVIYAITPSGMTVFVE